MIEGQYTGTSTWLQTVQIVNFAQLETESNVPPTQGALWDMCKWYIVSVLILL